MHFGEQLEKLMHELQLYNASQFAYSLGYPDHQKVSRLLPKNNPDGKNKPSFELVADILRAHKQVNANWLLADRGEMFLDESGQVKIHGSTVKGTGISVAQVLKNQVELLQSELKLKDVIIQEKERTIRVLQDSVKKMSK